MPLVRYSQFFFNPGGGEAAGVPMRVTLTGGNQLTRLFADKAGTQPLPNPLETSEDPAGLLSFFAPPGDYTVWYAGDAWPLPVDEDETDPAWPGLFIHHQITPATVWTIQHHFGVQPAVTVLSAGQRVEPETTHPSPTQTVLNFSSPQAGTAYLRR